MKKVIYKCQECGNEFEIEVLSPEESQERIEKKQPIYRIVCPKCKSQKLLRRN